MQLNAIIQIQLFYSIIQIQIIIKPVVERDNQNVLSVNVCVSCSCYFVFHMTKMPFLFSTFFFISVYFLFFFSTPHFKPTDLMLLLPL